MVEGTHPGVEDILEPTPWQLLRRRIFAHRGFTIGFSVLFLIILVALIGPYIGAHDPYQTDLTIRMSKPIWHSEGTWSHPLGTDQIGRDYLSRLIYGARISLFIGFSTVIISCFIGTVLGISGGYFGGRVGMVVSFIITVRLATPMIMVALAVVALFGPSLDVILWVIGVMLWKRVAVIIRCVTMQIRCLDYVSAARAVGCSTLRIVLTEIMPNLINNLIVIATLEMANAILIEAALSFLGLGIQPPMPSWGLMVSEGKDYIFFEPWMISIPGLAIFLLTLSINLLGDGIHDITIPGSVA